MVSLTEMFDKFIFILPFLLLIVIFVCMMYSEFVECKTDINLFDYGVRVMG